MDVILDLYHRHFDWRDLTLVLLSPVFAVFIAMEAWRFRRTGGRGRQGDGRDGRREERRVLHGKLL